MRRAVAGLLAAAALTGCGGDEPPAATDPAPPPVAAATTAPAASATPTRAPGTTACDAVTEAEAAAILRVAEVRSPDPKDPARCDYVPEAATDLTPYFSVTFDASAEVFDAERSRDRLGEGYEEIAAVGDRAYAYAGRVRVLAGERSFVVVATSERDRGKLWAHVGVETQAEYLRIATVAASLVATRA